MDTPPNGGRIRLVIARPLASATHIFGEYSRQIDVAAQSLDKGLQPNLLARPASFGIHWARSQLVTEVFEHGRNQKPLVLPSLAPAASQVAN